MKRNLPCLFLLIGSCALHAQSRPAQPFTLHDLAVEAMHHKSEVRDQQLNYTFLDTEDDVTHGGIFPSHHVTVSETIALVGQQYTRRISRDGKPLEGKALQHEQELYDEAIRQRRSVGELRSEQNKTATHSLEGTDKYLLTDFDVRQSKDDTVDGRACTVLIFEPRPSVPNASQSRVTWWVDKQTKTVLREYRSLLTVQGLMLPGSTFATHYAPVDGVLLLADQHLDLAWNEPALKNKKIHLIATHTFTNYRRFRTSVTLMPATAEDPARDIVPQQP